MRYGGERLISDKASIESFGIKDGDQVKFQDIDIYVQDFTVCIDVLSIRRKRQFSS